MKANMMFLAFVATALTGCATTKVPIYPADGSGVATRTVVGTPAIGVQTVSGPNSCTNENGPSMFNTEKECIAALESGSCAYYTPKYFGGFGRNPVNGRDKIEAPVEQNFCTLMQTTAGGRWVPQQEGTIVRYNVKDGVLGSIYARHDCGNPISKVSFPGTSSRQVVATQTQSVQCLESPGGIAGRNEKGQTTCSYPIAFSEEPWYKAAWVPYAVGAVLIGGLVAGLVFGIDGHHAASTLLGPGVITDPATVGPGVTTGF